MLHRLRLGFWCVLGVVITLGPMLSADILVRWAAISYGTERLSERAHHSLDHAEMILADASAVLTRLADTGQTNCSDAGIHQISETVFTHASIKEIGVYDRNAKLICSNFGIATREMHHAKYLKNDHSRISLAMMSTRVPGHRSLGVHVALENGEGGLVAMVENPSATFQKIHHDEESYGFTRLALTNGEPIVEFGIPIRRAESLSGDIVVVRSTSTTFPITVVLTAPKAPLLTSFENLQALAKIGGGIMGVIMLALGGAAARRRLTGQNEIADAIVANEFIPFYQPIVDAQTGRIAGCELLVRWRKADGEMVSPDLFVPLAESTGQIVEITKSLMRQVADDMAPVCAVQPDFYASINLVAAHFTNKTIVGDIRQMFSKGAMSPSNLVVEITERHPLVDLDRAKIVIESLQRLGVRVALDDAGTGHGGLAYIQSLGMDTIKIDRMFVDAIGTDAPSAPIVDALVDLGKQLKMTIIAEGVETEAQFAYLRVRGARYFQGFLFAPAMPISAFIKFFGAFNPVPSQTHVVDEPLVAQGAQALAF
ncbi:MAG: EAL domain-containing protein [Alphaproteobacteria bacterium]